MQYRGLTTLELARKVVRDLPKIRRVYFREYYYEPNKPSGSEERRFSLNREVFLRTGKLELPIQHLQEGWNIAFDSVVEDRRKKLWHLPLVDLALRKSQKNLRKTVRRLQEIIAPRFGAGYILATNRSYQFFGTRLLSHDEWLQFLAWCLLSSMVTVTPKNQENIHEMIADYRYIGHSLLRGSTGLRITAHGTKTVLPRVVAVVKS